MVKQDSETNDQNLDKKPAKRSRGRPFKYPQGYTEIPKVHVNFYLSDSESIERFERIREKHGFGSKADTFRHCLDRAYEMDMIGRGDIELDPPVKKALELILDNEFLSGRLLADSEDRISGLNKLVNDAVTDYLRTLRQEMNLHNFSFINGLEKDEQQIANVFKQHQVKYPSGMTVEDLKGYLPEMPEIHIKNKLIKFSEIIIAGNRLVNKMEIDGEDHYYAPSY
ncbi:MAG: hypothetical protein ACFFD4_34540 [Candidatus Odinarchaeota archaeon]